LKKYFDALGEKCQKILTLFYYQQYNIKEIMAEGNYNSENVVKSQKSRCLKTLKEAINNALNI
jgi:RNA polymerase sigma-70 factor (ECF subfamily)